MSLRLRQCVMGTREPLRRLSRRSRRRSWSREERESIGPRRLREGRVREVTRPLVQFTPTHEAVHAVEELEGSDQLERRVPWRSVWERKRISAAVSLSEVPVKKVAEAGKTVAEDEAQRERTKKRSEKGKRSIDSPDRKSVV